MHVSTSIPAPSIAHVWTGFYPMVQPVTSATTTSHTVSGNKKHMFLTGLYHCSAECDI